ncbi:MAG: CPBP family intramembrane metalloprotease [Chloroflexi bacterium]|nr:MAG: CPBP family intramembrane metalloprotease [Chloroflexota bacterium]
MTLPELSPDTWLLLSRTAVILLTALLGWITYRSHLLLQVFTPPYNLLTAWPEQAVRLVFIALFLLPVYLSGLPAEVFGLVSPRPAATILSGVVLGGIIAVGVNLLSFWSIRRFGPQIYSPRLLKNILPRRPLDWPLVFLGLLPAALMEELLYRSLWLGLFSDLVPPVLLVLFTSLFFGLMHLPQGRLGVAVTAGMNVLLCLLFYGSNQLLLPLVVHYTVNVVQVITGYVWKDWLFAVN